MLFGKAWIAAIWPWKTASLSRVWPWIKTFRKPQKTWIPYSIHSMKVVALCTGKYLTNGGNYGDFFWPWFSECKYQTVCYSKTLSIMLFIQRKYCFVNVHCRLILWLYPFKRRQRPLTRSVDAVMAGSWNKTDLEEALKPQSAHKKNMTMLLLNSGSFNGRVSMRYITLQYCVFLNGESETWKHIFWAALGSAGFASNNFSLGSKMGSVCFLFERKMGKTGPSFPIKFFKAKWKEKILFFAFKDKNRSLSLRFFCFASTHNLLCHFALQFSFRI